jgi:hypothetical protein
MFGIVGDGRYGPSVGRKNFASETEIPGMRWQEKMFVITDALSSENNLRCGPAGAVPCGPQLFN